MRLLCPNCQESLTVPDSEGGKTVNCIYCGRTFSAPLPYESSSYAMAAEPTPPSKAGSPPAAIPPSAVPAAKPAPMPPPTEGRDLPSLPAPDRELSGYGNIRTFSLDPAIIRWVVPVALFVAFILTFCSWDGIYPAGYPAYTQSAWGCLSGGVAYDQVAEDAIGLLKDLEERVHMNWWLFPYLVLLFAALILAWAGPIVDLLRLKLPANALHLWQYRPALLGIIAIVTLLILSAQWATGFGLQRAIRERVEVQFAEEKAAANTPEKIQRIEMKEAMERGKYQVRTTVWLRLAYLMNLLAALAVVAEAGLTLRGNKPVPRAGVMW